MTGGVVLDFTPRFKRACKHGEYKIDESLNHVECKFCGKEVSPMFVLVEMAQTESRYKRNLDELRKEIESLKSKMNCKCKHCNKMTPIKRA